MRRLPILGLIMFGLALASCSARQDLAPGSSAGWGGAGAGEGGSEAGQAGDQAGQGGAGGDDSKLEGHFDFELEFSAKAMSCVSGLPSEERSWVLVGAVDFDGASAKGYLALNGLAQPDGTTVRYTLGATDFEGASMGLRTHWEADVLYEEGGPPEDELALALDLRFTEDGVIDGRGEGVWLQAEADFRCERPFMASVTGGPDRHAPDAVADQREPYLLLPFDSITGYFTEPVSAAGLELTVRAADREVPAELELLQDHGGRPRAFEIASPDVWPSGVTLTAELRTLRDGAGNEADVVLGPFTLPTEPDSASNSGFENGLADWLTDPSEPGGPVQSVMASNFVDDLGKPFSVIPPEASRMVYIDAIGVRLIGHFAPSEPANGVAMMLGVSDPTISDLRDFPAGFRISVFSHGELSVIGDGSDLPEVLPDARGNFSGFVDLSFALPDGSGDDFWLIVEPWGYAPPVHLPSLLVDDVRLR